MPFWSRGQKGVALMRFGGGDGAACLVRAVRMWERTCGLELLGSVASILATVDCARGITADGVFHLQDLRLQVAQVFGSHSCRQVSGMLTLSSRSSR